MKKYKTFCETVYSAPFWDFLIHITRSPQDKKSILKNGFDISRNPVILKGVYCVPDCWYMGTTRKNDPSRIDIYTKHNTKVFDTDANRPIDSLQGIGTKQWNTLYCEILSKLGIKIIPKGNFSWEYYFEKNSIKIKEFLNDFELRERYQKLLYNVLIKQYDVVVNGGELIIINPKCIDHLE